MSRGVLGPLSKGRIALGTFLVIAALLLTVNVSAVMLRRIGAVVLKDTYRTIFFHQLALCLVLLLFALDVRFGFLTAFRAPVLKGIGWAVRGLFIACTCVILFFGAKAGLGGLGSTAAPAGHALVLGMALENGEPVKDLLYRLDTARAYLDENPEAVLVLTGGNPDEQGRTEAAVMMALLSAQGVPEDSMLPEDRAETTEENFKNTLALVDPSEPVVLITSNYHMDRAAGLAKKAGFCNVLRLPAPSDPLRFAPNLLWEVVMDLNSLLKGG